MLTLKFKVSRKHHIYSIYFQLFYPYNFLQEMLWEIDLYRQIKVILLRKIEIILEISHDLHLIVRSN